MTFPTSPALSFRRDPCPLISDHSSSLTGQAWKGLTGMQHRWSVGLRRTLAGYHILSNRYSAPLLLIQLFYRPFFPLAVESQHVGSV